MKTLTQIEALAIDLMNQHGLYDWSFAWSKAKRINGTCSHRKKQIRLSAILSPIRNITEVKNTILHEIAHALVGSGHGHDYVWFNKAIEIGCNGQRCSNDKVDIQAKYEANCDCGRVHKAHRRPKRSKSCICKGRMFNSLDTLNFVQQY